MISPFDFWPGMFGRPTEARVGWRDLDSSWSSAPPRRAAAPSDTGRWDARFLDLAAHVSSWSKDAETKVGAVAVGADRDVLATGYNGPPRGVDDLPERLTRPGKYLWTAHAEANAVAHAARHGVSLRGASVFITHPPCAECTKLLINAGIARVVWRAGALSPSWAENREAAAAMLAEAGVEVMIHPPEAPA